MCSEEVVISASNLAKSYRLFNHPGDRIKQFVSLGLKRYHHEFCALSEVSFVIRRGETVGIVGPNGSGKSTLLQLICGILKPTRGSVSVAGQVSALLELGAGFNPEFTGRENVYFQGMLLGFSKAQMGVHFADVVAFADIGEFIDQPVRTYSSGMFVRLAFAVAVSVEPDILVVDEALAVGDAAFQAKCLRRMEVIRERGGTILLVTHAIEQVTHLCDRVLMLEKGRLIADGDSVSTLARYFEKMAPDNEQRVSQGKLENLSCEVGDEPLVRHPAYNPAEKRWGDRRAAITDVWILQDDVENPKLLLPGRELEIRYRVDFHADVVGPLFGMRIRSSEGAVRLATNSRELGTYSKELQCRSGESLLVSFKFTPFCQAVTTASCSVWLVS